MLKKTVTYVDYNGVKRTEDFYFNLTKAEVAEMELSVQGGFSKMLEEIVASKDNVQIVNLFKQMVLKSYGEKSPDGRRFIKSDEIAQAFAQTEAGLLIWDQMVARGAVGLLQLVRQNRLQVL